MDSLDWVGCMNEPSAWLRWIECHPSSIAAIQTGVLFLTVVVAIGIPTLIAMRDSRERERARDARTVSLAQSLLGAVFVLDADIIRARRFLETHRTQPSSAKLHEDWFRNLHIFVPAELIDSVQFMHECDVRLIDPFRRSAFLSQTYNNYVRMYGQQSVNAEPEVWDALVERIDETMRSVSDATLDARDTFTHR